MTLIYRSPGAIPPMFAGSKITQHYQGVTTTLAKCVKLLLIDNTVELYTDHDQDITFDGELYIASSAVGSSAVSDDVRMSTNSVDLEGLIEANGILEANVVARKYDNARVEILEVDYTNPDATGPRKLRAGWLGTISLEEGRFKAEIGGLGAVFSKRIGRVYTAKCDADVGDVRCGVNLASITFTGSVAAVEDEGNTLRITLATDPGTMDPVFDLGVLKLVSGLNDGSAIEIKQDLPVAISDRRFTLHNKFPFTVLPGEQVVLIQGCDKTQGICQTRYGNVVNFRGFRDIPGSSIGEVETALIGKEE